MGLIYKEEFTIPYSMSDVNHLANLPALLGECISVSGRQSIALDNSDDWVFENYGLVWIITDHDIQVNHLPRLYETVVIETEALAYNKFFCYRAFRVLDQEGQLLVDICSSFALLDWESRKVHPVLPEIVACYQADFEKKLRRGPKYSTLDHFASEDYRVRFYDIDMNGHVNNGRYIEWVYEVMGFDFLSHHIPKRLQLKYSKEVSPGGLIQSRYELDGLTSQHEIVSDGQVNAQAIVRWQNVEEDYVS
ncbi:acyl-ACP thioesterase domain-containing protein [Streptococcus sp. DD13]|uniref:acyl-ACP thioesterase domain-containing protein n=1 Tax=Streptococcus sp. DD13 TaxID=1777881 RepID=UPI0007986D0A|nr:acyl-ACP thioesterase domain-containing protein [Streptococcus sp. DD13]KXT79015.1 Acyl-ACP thioesterase [Streptococcus sp. DD13]